MKRMGLILLGAVLITVGFLTFDKLQARRPGVASSCPDWVLSQTQNSTDVITPRDVVVEPWRGRHNVHGTFVIPDGYQPSSFFVVELKDSNPYCGYIRYSKTQTPINANGDRQALGVFRTRTTLWLLTKGQIKQLEEPQNWKLAIFKQS